MKRKKAEFTRISGLVSGFLRRQGIPPEKIIKAQVLRATEQAVSETIPGLQGQADVRADKDFNITITVSNQYLAQEVLLRLTELRDNINARLEAPRIQKIQVKVKTGKY
ncbi:MAG TPA: DciA family protein [bacterium]|nr:DciA family protein [bacterium]